MSNDMKRVGLVFNEDGSVNFTKSINLVNASLKENYQSFKLVQSQWDSSTTSTQKLKDKLEYLNKAYDTQKDKVTTLKKQLEELENAENRNEVAIQQKKATLLQAETGLQKYKNQIDETSSKLKTGSQKIEEYAKNVTSAGDKIEKVGSKMSAFSMASVAALGASVGASIEFESAFAGVEKTVDATDSELAKMKEQIRQLAREIPATTTEISGVAEAAGQLGIKTEDIMGFTRVMIDLGNSTNLSSEEAASSLAKFANVTKMSASDYSKLGSTIVALGNNFATTERDIVEMATRLASTGELTGLSQAQIMSLATSMSSVGIEAEAGGSAMSKLLKQIQLATELGGKELEQFSGVAGMTGAEFKQAFEKDAASALTVFLSGLNDTERNGKSAIAVLDEMGITEVRMSNTVLSLANASDVMNNALDLGNKAWEENNALTNESSKRYETLKSKLQVSLNKIIDMGISLGNKLMPKLESVIGVVGIWIDRFSKLNDEQISTIVNIGLVVAALGPAISIIGKVTTTIGGTIGAFGAFREALNVAMGTATSAKTSVNALATVFSAITSPIGLACTAIVASVALIALTTNKVAKEAEKDFESMGNGAVDFVNGIATANSHLSSFNSTLFATSEEQQKLAEDMDNVQKGITQICKTAADERRGYTQEEITQLNEYFTKLRELKDKELEIQKSIGNSITQQATQNAQSFQGGLDAYKLQSQEWIKTAQDQANAEKTIINDRTTQEIALLQQRYGDKAVLENEEYAREYNAVMQNKEKNIQEAINQVTRVTQAYADGYTQRAEKESGFYADILTSNTQAEEENKRHTDRLEEINNGWYATEAMRKSAIEGENAGHNLNMRKIWEDMYKNMDETESEQLGSWLGMLSNTELYGGKIDSKSQKMVDNILASYDSMPPKTQKSMKNAMSPMLDEMKKSEPSLYSKANGIADGILSRLRKSFDIHSPSRKTQEIFQNVMSPAETEMEKSKKVLFKQAEEIAEGITDRFENTETELDLSNVSRNSRNSSDVGNMKIIYDFINSIKSGSLIDYSRLENTITKALSNCKFEIAEDGFVKIIKNEIYKVV